MADWTIWASAVAVCAMGIAALWLSLRGRRVNDHKLCRRCRFDLDGLVLPTTCPECGRRIETSWHYRTGARQRVWWGVAVAAVLLALGIGLATFLSVRWARGVTNWYAQMPTWVLVARADGWLGWACPFDPGVLEELEQRIMGKTLSQGTGEMLAQRGLAAQKDAARTWEPMWGNIVLAAWEQQWVSAEEFQGFLEGAMDVNVISRRRIEQGQGGVPGLVELIGKRMPRDWELRGEMSRVVVRVVRDDGDQETNCGEYAIESPILFDAASGIVFPARRNRRGEIATSVANTRFPVSTSLEIGVHRLRLSAEMHVRLSRGASFRQAGDRPRTRDAVMYAGRVWETGLEVVGSGQPVVGVVADAEAAKTIKENMLIRATWDDSRRRSGGAFVDDFRLHYSIPQTVRRLSFRVLIKDADQAGARWTEWETIGDSAWFWGNGSTMAALSFDSGITNRTRRVDIEFVPGFAELIPGFRSSDWFVADEIAGVRVLFENVPVTREGEPEAEWVKPSRSEAERVW